MYNTDLPTRAELPSTGQLLRSTTIAVLIASGLLITTILPAEYGIDTTGVGRVMGLTKMGEIKTSLSRETNTKKRHSLQVSHPKGRSVSLPKSSKPPAAQKWIRLNNTP